VAHDVSIEVFDGELPAAAWSSAHGDELVEAGLLHGLVEWRWHQLPWGVVLELSFRDEDAWDRFRESAACRAALDAVPDPVSGVLVYKGFGGSNGSGVRRRPRPLRGAGAAALPLPVPDDRLDELWERAAAPRVLALR
jgi:hypothetical protein